MINAKNILQAHKILLIEDDDGLIPFISLILEHGGYQAIVAQTGKQGVELARQELPDLILCDIMMPEMDGFDVLHALQNRSDTAMIPFIFLTARSLPEDVRAGMELGADDYLTKPVSATVLLNAVSTRLNRHQALKADRLAVFTQQLVLSQEHRQQRMAHVLDSEINQSLRSLQFVFNLLDPPTHQDASLYNGAKELLGNLVQRVEGLAQGLHPTMLERLGLLSAIRWLTEQYELTIQLETENLDYEFPSHIEICVFRLIQESLNNIARYAQTTEAKITLKYTDQFVELRVEDNGVGFNLEEVLQSSQNMGLQYMYGLVAWAKGELHITSEPNKGTAVYALLPQAIVDPAKRPSISQRFLRLAGGSRTQQIRGVSSESTKVKVLLAMEQSLQLQGMRRLLKDNVHIQVIDEVQNLNQTTEAIEEHGPDLVVITPITEDKSQTEILHEIMEAHPETAVLVISADTHDEYVRDAFDSGALGFIPNTATITDLHTAIMRVAKKQYYLSQVLTFDLARWRTAQTHKNLDTASS